MSEVRCPRCDRLECPCASYEWPDARAHAEADDSVPDAFEAEAILSLYRGCCGEPVDWRARALEPAEHDPLACPCCRAAGEIEAERDAVLSAAADRLAQAEGRIAALEASLGECARWLLDHGQHTPRCPVPHAAWHSTGEACTCGLDDLVQRAEALLALDLDTVAATARRAAEEGK